MPRVRHRADVDVDVDVDPLVGGACLLTPTAAAPTTPPGQCSRYRSAALRYEVALAAGCEAAEGLFVLVQL